MPPWHTRVYTPTNSSVDPLRDQCAMYGNSSSVDLGRRQFRVLASKSRVAVVKLGGFIGCYHSSLSPLRGCHIFVFVVPNRSPQQSALRKSEPTCRPYRRGEQAVFTGRRVFGGGVLHEIDAPPCWVVGVSIHSSSKSTVFNPFPSLPAPLLSGNAVAPVGHTSTG